MSRKALTINSSWVFEVIGTVFTGIEYATYARLDAIEYIPLHSMDRNRWEDAVYRRDPDDPDSSPPSVLEMLVAFAERLSVNDTEEHEPKYYLDKMIETLLDGCPPENIEDRVYLWYERTETPKGRVGLFPGNTAEVDLWYQAMWWLDGPH